MTDEAGEQLLAFLSDLVEDGEEAAPGPDTTATK